MNVYTAEEVAGILKVEYKTALRLIERGLLKALPGIRHKRITEQELNRYLGNQEILSDARAMASQTLPAGHGQPVARPLGRSVRPSGVSGEVKQTIVVTSTAAASGGVRSRKQPRK